MCWREKKKWAIQMFVLAGRLLPKALGVFCIHYLRTLQGPRLDIK